MNSLVPASKEHSKIDWTPAMDRYFVKLLLDQLKKGNKVCNTFKKQAWNDMLTLFNGKFGPKYGKSFLKHRFKKLLKYYIDVKSLLEVKGFSWDEIQQRYQQMIIYGIITSRYTIIYSYWYTFLLYFMCTIADVGTPRCAFIS